MQYHQKAETAFTRVLNNIPKKDQDRIYQYWLSLGAEKPVIHACTATRIIAVAEGQISVAGTIGTEFYFRYELFDHAPDDVLDAIIAHELAHSLNGLDQEVDTLYARYNRLVDSLSGHPTEEIEKREAANHHRIEEAADRVATKWNYDVEKAKKWCAEFFGGLNLGDQKERPA
jgi:hypothetical protein